MSLAHERLIAGVALSAIRDVALRHGAKRVSLFGSLARAEERKGSDLDLLIELEQCRSLLDLIAIKQDLEDLTGIRVDVVTERSLSPYFRDAVLKEATAL